MHNNPSHPPENFRIEEPVLVLVGPTAVGKTALSLALAQRFAGEIVGLDSMQIYRYMDIGTAKPSLEERAQVRHHLIDVIEPDEDYHVARYVGEAVSVCREIVSRHRLPILVGGSGLYLKGLLSGLFDADSANQLELRALLKKRLVEEGRAPLFAELTACDPESAARIHINDSQRLLRALEIFQATGRPWSEHLRQQSPTKPFTRILKIGLRCERELLYQRIDQRVGTMLAAGFEAEVQFLLARGYSPDLKPMQSIGYRHLVNLIRGDWSWEEAEALLARDTRRYAKRQLTWFGADPEIHWFSPWDEAGISDLVSGFLAGGNTLKNEYSESSDHQ